MQIDWDAGHGPFTGPISAAGTALAATYAAGAADAPVWWAAAVTGAGLLGSHVAGVLTNATRGTLALRAAAWIGACSWCSWALTVGPWTTNCLAALAAGAVGLGAAMGGVRHAQTKADEQAAVEQRAADRANLARRDRVLADEWIARIARVCGVDNVQIVGIEHFEGGGGFELDGVPPPGGTTWRDIQRWQDALAADAQLPNGCGVEVTEGGNRGAFLMTVTTENHLVGEEFYPDDYSPRTLNDGALLGVLRAGDVVDPCLRQVTTLLTGRKGSGKTNLMHVAIAAQARMTDNLCWVIDLNGGGLALPWLRAWHRAGRPGRPPIDWVADNPAKLLAMAEAMLRIAKARKPGYADLMIEHNDDKIPTSPQVPGIMANADEIAELYSAKARRNETLRKAGDVLLQVVELARAAAVNLLASALRATQDVLEEPQLLAQAGLKIGMKSDERELAYLMGWQDKLSAADAPYPGCGFVKVLDEPARPFKAYRITPKQIAEIVVATADLHPELDELSRKAAGEAYERRWDNTAHLFDGSIEAAAPAPQAVESAPQAPREGWTDPTAGWGTTDTAPPTTGPDPIAEADAAMQRIRGDIDETSRRDPDLEAQARAIFEQGGMGWTPPADPIADDPQPGKREDPRKEIVFEIVLKAGPNGIGPEAIRDIMRRRHPAHEPPHAATIGRWLDADPRTHKPAYGRYAVRPAK